MKQIFRNLFALLLALVMLLSLSVTAFAADSSITFKGAQEGFDFQPGSQYTVTDLFDSFKDVMPGDKLTETIQVKNEASDCDYIKLYMRAVVHDENGNPLTYDETFENTDGKDQANVAGKRDETVATMQDFLSQLSMKVYRDRTLLFEASPDELGGFQSNVYLGAFRHGESVGLTVELEVPISLGNDFANRVGEVDWIFLAEGLDDLEPPQESSPLEQPEKEEVSSPKTGDASPIMLYSILVCLSGCALIVLAVFRVRSQDKED